MRWGGGGGEDEGSSYLKVVFLQLVSPSLVKRPLGLQPLFLLGLQSIQHNTFLLSLSIWMALIYIVPLQYNRHGHCRVLLQALNDIRSLITIDPVIRCNT